MNKLFLFHSEPYFFLDGVLQDSIYPLLLHRVSRAGNEYFETFFGKKGQFKDKDFDIE